MTTGFVYHDAFLDHDTGPGHPERPDRLQALLQQLRISHLWTELAQIPFDPVNPALVRQLHEAAYLHRLQQACQTGKPFIDAPDSAISRHSYDIAQLAAGGVVAAVDHVMAGEVGNAFCAVRPPGHHAEADRSMGFCLLNNIALAAQHLVDHHRLHRVAVVDFDVHHGNGTQHLFEHRDDVLFISLHQDGIYPGTGRAEETGKAAGKGYTMNIPLAAGSGDSAYQAAFESAVLPTLLRFEPQFLLISAGFDAAAGDPLAQQRVSADGFAWMTQALLSAARRSCRGRMVSVLEGGYNLRSLADAARRHVAVLMGEE